MLYCSASDFVSKSPADQVYCQPISLPIRAKKDSPPVHLREYFQGQFLRWIAIMSIEHAVATALTRELNNCYCLNLPTLPDLNCGTANPL